MPDIIGTGEITMHAVQRRGLRRPQMGAAILDLVPVERDDAAIIRDRRSQCGSAISGGDRSGEMLQPVFDPFDRAADGASRRSDQHDIREDTLLDAEAPAGIRRRAQTQAVTWHLERARQHRMDAKRALEIGEHVEGILARVVVGDHAISLDGRAGVARVPDVDANAMRCGAERLLGVAVAEAAVACDIAGKSVVQERRARGDRRKRIDDCGADAVLDFNKINDVLSTVAVPRYHDCHGLTDIAHTVDCNRPAFNWRLDADRQT